MNIYIDFDGTLFDSDKLLSDYINLLKNYNISSDTVNEVIANIFKEEKFNLFRLTNFLLKHYNLSRSIQSKIDKLFMNKYVYADVVPFLDKIKTKFNLILLTYGDYEYQSYKIKMSKLSDYFTNVIITKNSKSKLDINYQNAIFIDNNPKEIKGYSDAGCSKLIRLRRSDDKYSSIETNVSNVLEYKSFDDNIINKCKEMSDKNE